MQQGRIALGAWIGFIPHMRHFETGPRSGFPLGIQWIYCLKAALCHRNTCIDERDSNRSFESKTAKLTALCEPKRTQEWVKSVAWGLSTVNTPLMTHNPAKLSQPRAKLFRYVIHWWLALYWCNVRVLKPMNWNRFIKRSNRMQTRFCDVKNRLIRILRL